MLSPMSVRLDGPAGSWTLPSGTSVLGRGVGCEVRIDDPRLSRRHASFLVDGARVVVRDLGATNGVLVNGRRIRGTQTLNHGDSVTCGPMVLAVSIAVSEPHPRELLGRSATEFVPHADSVNTDAMDPAAVAATVAALTDRKINARIAEAVPVEPSAASSFLEPGDAPDRASSLVPALPGRRPPSVGTGVPPAPAEERASALMPQPLIRLPASALSSTANPSPPAAPQVPRLSTALLPASAVTDGGQMPLLLRPGRQAHTPGLRRLAAAAGDGLLAWLAASCAAVPSLALGYGQALAKAGATLHGGLPVLPPTTGTSATAWEFSASVLDPGGLARAVEIALTLRRVDSDAFFLLFLGATGAVLAVVLASLLVLVAPTVWFGGPPCHRALGLTIESLNGHRLGWFQASLRWLLALLLSPLAWFTLAAGRPSIHDRLSGCRLGGQLGESAEVQQNSRKPA
ncbi:hypothetical protein LBMAG53_09940 [Planctomycetota bacterium]|nr:hypothetical protein LBMAG53_09940 [Planctomycetota bacterium]